MSDSLTDDIRAIIEAERERFGVPGCAVVVAVDGEIELCEGFGRRDIAHDLPVTTSTLFPIGSSTKTFTAAVCASLVEAGQLEWDRPVRDYLPDFRMYDAVATDQLTIRDMLGHRSGLPRHDLYWYTAEPSMTRDELIHGLRDLAPSHGFREVWQYNNLLYTTSGHLAGRLHGSDFESAVRQRVLEPLGMKRTNFSVDDSQQDADFARPYLQRPADADVTEIDFARLDLVGPAGNINSSAEEMGAWLLTLLGKGVDGKPPLLSDPTLRELRTPVAHLPQDSPLSVGRSVGYCLGLLLEDYRGFRVSHHGGNIDGFSSQVSCIADEGLGVVVLTNRDGTAMRDALRYLIYDRVLGHAAEPHGETLLAKEQALRAGMHQAQEARKSSAKPLPCPRPVADYAGRYRHPAYGELLVIVDGESLSAGYRQLHGPLEHRHLDVFDLVVSLGGQERRLPVHFTYTAEGDIDAALVPLEPSVPRISFSRVPPTEHLTDELLNRLAGSYLLGPLRAQIKRRGEHELLVSIEGSEPTPLVPVHDLVFTLQGQRVEFTDDGRVLTPLGEFVRE
jgi:CubicO group peptidase (beta-lactamase class C family)